MNEIGIVTEETADLPLEIIEKHQIAVVPVILTWPELRNMPGDNTFQKMRELERRGINSFGKTSQPTPNDFLAKFKDQMNKFHKVLCVNLTSKLSGSYNSAILAKSMLTPQEQQRVFLFDSLNGSGGQALFILKATDLINKDRSIQDVLKELTQSIPKVHLFIMFKDPKWLATSGRISHVLANVIQGMGRIGVRPILTTRNGEIVMGGLKTRAKDAAAALYKQLSKDTEQARKFGRRIRIAITHGDDPEGAQKLREMAEREFKNLEVAFTNIINNVVGAPAGPGTLAVAWCEITE
jgi:DegV family protein with EDD domain